MEGPKSGVSVRNTAGRRAMLSAIGTRTPGALSPRRDEEPMLSHHTPPSRAGSETTTTTTTNQRREFFLRGPRSGTAPALLGGSGGNGSVVSVRSALWNSKKSSAPNNNNSSEENVTVNPTRWSELPKAVVPETTVDKSVLDEHFDVALVALRFVCKKVLFFALSRSRPAG